MNKLRNNGKAKKHEDTIALGIAPAIITLLSFGLLSLSSFPAIHLFGMTMLFGILFSYLLSPMTVLGQKK